MRDHTPEALRRARSLRGEMTYPEQRLWSVLRDRQINRWKWRRQHPKGVYILDFFCHEAGLVVEIDGDSHAYQKNYDDNRTAWLEQQGLRVMRFTNEDVIQNLNEVFIKIIRACEERSPHPDLPPKGEGARKED